MERKLLDVLPVGFPDEARRFVGGAKVYDSSCSPEARVYFIDKDGGYYLKTSAQGTLKREAEMTAYFHRKGLGADVLGYSQDGGADWLLTSRVRGEDLTYKDYISEPKRLSEFLGCKLRELHELDFSDCPVKDRVSEYLALAESNYRTGNYDKSHFPDSFGYASADEAYRVLSSGKEALKSDTLIHGDYCLPNIMLDNWNFSGFIDLGNAGVGDRHIDIFWGAWTLGFNLGTDAYRCRFLDAYGRDKADEDVLLTIAAAEVFG
jgi:kanamycin kinase